MRTETRRAQADTNREATRLVVTVTGTNRWVFGVKHPFPASASRLLPEYQHLAVGDLICDGPGYASYFRVLL